MKINRMSLAAASLALPVLSGCSGAWTVDENVDRLSAVAPQGNEFTRSLTNEYRQFATYEKDEMYDWRDADYFARKGLRTADGSVVEPERIEQRNLPRHKRGELAEARQRLVQSLDAGGRSLAPESAARAQAKFDCWMEQQEENHQPGHIAACREAFWAALEETEVAVNTAGERKAAFVPVRSEGPYRVFFDFNSAELTSAAKKVLDDFVANANTAGSGRIVIEGHADRVGSARYNSRLSERRAAAVREYLTNAGLVSARMNITERAYGEAQPMVETRDGVREPANRRAVIIIEE